MMFQTLFGTFKRCRSHNFFNVPLWQEALEASGHTALQLRLSPLLTLRVHATVPYGQHEIRISELGIFHGRAGSRQRLDRLCRPTWHSRPMRTMVFMISLNLLRKFTRQSNGREHKRILTSAIRGFRHYNCIFRKFWLENHGRCLPPHPQLLIDATPDDVFITRWKFHAAFQCNTQKYILQDNFYYRCTVCAQHLNLKR